MEKSKDQDRGKGAKEEDQQSQGGNTSMRGELGHRDEDVELKNADSNLGWLNCSALPFGFVQVQNEGCPKPLRITGMLGCHLGCLNVLGLPALWPLSHVELHSLPFL